MKLFWRIPLAVVLVTGASLSLQASALLNGSFESQTVPASPGYTVLAVGALVGLDNWSIVGPGSGNVAVISGTFAPAGYALAAEDANQWVDLTGSTSFVAQGVEQTVATTIGTQYTLSFWVGNVSDAAHGLGTTSTVDVLLGGIGGSSLGAFTNSNATPSAMNWQQFTTTFTATGSSTTLDFLNGDGIGDDLNGLDNVVLTATGTPEPATLWLLGGGMIGLGFLRRRKAV